LLGLIFVLAGGGQTRADNAQYYYDPGGRLIGVIDPTVGSATYNYDQAGNITSITRTPIATLSVMQFYPTRGTSGTTVTVNGTGFGTTANTTVKFNGVSATPSVVTQTSITVTVPASATTGPLSVTVSSNTVTSTTFTVAAATAAPTITSFTPTTQVQGSSVTITGTNFDTTNSKVYVNGQAAKVTAATATSIAFNVPQASSGKVTVTTPAGTAVSSADLIVAPAGYTAANVFNATRISANAVTKTISTSTTGTVSLVLFDATANQIVSNFSNFAGIPSCANVWLLSPSGSVIIPSSGQCGTQWFGPLSLAAGTYSLVVAPSGSTPGSFTSVLYDVTAPITHSITIGGPLDDIIIRNPGQQGIETFAGTAGQKVLIRLDYSQFNCATYSIQNPDGSYLLAGQGVCNSLLYPTNAPIALTQTGTYKIVYTPSLPGHAANDGVGVLATRVYNVPSNVTGSVTVDGAEVFQTYSPGQNGSLTFSATNGQKLSIFMDFNWLANGCGTFVIKDPSNADLVPSTHQCGTFYATGAPVPITVTGTYTINFTPDLYVVGLPTGQAGTRIMSVPANATATATIDGNAVAVAESVPGQQATVTFTGTLNQRFNAWLDFNPVAGNCANYTITTGATTVVPSTDQCNAKYLTGAPITLPATGTYTITIKPALTGSLASGIGAETIRLFTVPADPSPTLANGVPTAVDLTVASQKAVFRFPGTSGDKISAQVALYAAVFNYCATVEIRNPDNSTDVLAPTRFCNDTYLGGNRFSLSQTGSYYLIVKPDPGGELGASKGFAVATFFKSPADAGGTITIGGGDLTAYVSTPGQNATFNFAGTASQVVKFHLELGRMTTCNTVSVLNPSSTAIYGPVDSCSSTLDTGALTLSTAGTYKLVVSPDLVNGGNQTLTSATGWLSANVAAGP
jgi:YD repeat-containing protein